MNSIVSTTAGQIEGKVSQDGVHRFFGVPYAAAPFGVHRFRDPQPPIAWDGIRPAHDKGPVFSQRAMRALVGEVMPLDLNQSLDALTLNVWTPEPGQAGLPVMVFIHGGGYYSGSGKDEIYDGSSFARDGIVAVTINYRLGADGFLFHPDDPSPQEARGAFGIADQIAALRWIRENIAAFGGNPDQVTVVGESAGAMSVGTLLTAPSARGLFKRAIMQSGAPDKASNVGVAERISRRFLHHLGNPSFEELQATPIDRTLAVQAEMAAELASPAGLELYGPDALAQTILFVPTYGTPLIPVFPMSQEITTSPDVDVLLGDNLNETTIFLQPLPDDTLRALVHRYLSLASGFEEVDRLVNAFSGSSEVGRDALIRADSERQFGLPIRQFASRLVSRGHRVFKYRFEEPNVARPELGAHHLLELPYVFNTGDTAQSMKMAGNLNMETRQAVRRAWRSFIESGTPESANDGAWPAYNVADRLLTVFANGSHSGTDHTATEWSHWIHD